LALGWNAAETEEHKRKFTNTTAEFHTFKVWSELFTEINKRAAEREISQAKSWLDQCQNTAPDVVEHNLTNVSRIEGPSQDSASLKDWKAGQRWLTLLLLRGHEQWKAEAESRDTAKKLQELERKTELIQAQNKPREKELEDQRLQAVEAAQVAKQNSADLARELAQLQVQKSEKEKKRKKSFSKEDRQEQMEMSLGTRARNRRKLEDHEEDRLPPVCKLSPGEKALLNSGERVKADWNEKNAGLKTSAELQQAQGTAAPAAPTVTATQTPAKKSKPEKEQSGTKKGRTGRRDKDKPKDDKYYHIRNASAEPTKPKSAEQNENGKEHDPAKFDAKCVELAMSLKKSGAVATGGLAAESKDEGHHTQPVQAAYSSSEAPPAHEPQAAAEGERTVRWGAPAQDHEVVDGQPVAAKWIGEPSAVATEEPVPQKLPKEDIFEEAETKEAERQKKLAAASASASEDARVSTSASSSASKASGSAERVPEGKPQEESSDESDGSDYSDYDSEASEDQVSEEEQELPEGAIHTSSAPTSRRYQVSSPDPARYQTESPADEPEEPAPVVTEPPKPEAPTVQRKLFIEKIVKKCTNQDCELFGERTRCEANEPESWFCDLCQCKYK